MIAAVNTIKPYSRILKRMGTSVWKLLTINALILSMLLYTFMFTDAQRHEDFYLNNFILNGLILYLALFPCFKALIDLTSLYIFRSQLYSYKMQVGEFISEYDYTVYIKKPLRKIQDLFLLYPLALMAHAAMALSCYYLKDHFL